MFWKIAADLQENTHAEVRFQQSCKATIFKSHFGMGVLLKLCCIFSEHFSLRPPLDGCFCILLWCFHGWLRTTECWLGGFKDLRSVVCWISQIISFSRSFLTRNFPNVIKYLTLCRKYIYCKLLKEWYVTNIIFKRNFDLFKGTLMQTRKSLYMFMFMLKYYPENFTF